MEKYAQSSSSCWTIAIRLQLHGYCLYDRWTIIDYELTEKGTPFKGTIISRPEYRQGGSKTIDQPALVFAQIGD